MKQWAYSLTQRLLAHGGDKHHFFFLIWKGRTGPKTALAAKQKLRPRAILDQGHQPVVILVSCFFFIFYIYFLCTSKRAVQTRSNITGVISRFLLPFVVSSWPCAHFNWPVVSAGHHKNCGTGSVWGIESPSAHFGRHSHISIPLYSNFHDLHMEIRTPETASLLARLAQSSVAGYCIEEHITAEQSELGSWACRYCNFKSPLNSHVPVQWGCCSSQMSLR